VWPHDVENFQGSTFYSIHEIWWDTYFDVIEEWRQRYGNRHLEIRKMKIKEANLFNTVGCCIYKKTMVKFVIYLLFSYHVSSYFMYRVSHEGKYCTKFLNQYSFICSKFYKLYKYKFSYQTGYIMWHSRLTIYIPFGCASGNIDPKPGMSH
jgi:hypothetical protein